MNFRPKLGLMAAMAVIAVGTTGCIHLHNPFHGGGGGRSSSSKYKGTGERISLNAYDESLHVSDALKGQDFYLPDPAPVTEWPLPGGTPEQSVEHVDAGRDFAIAWRSGFGKGSDRKWHVTAPPVVGDGRIYVMDGGDDVSALEANSGRQIWRVNLTPHARHNGEAFGGGVAYADGKLYVTSGYRYVASLNAADGKLLWRTAVDAPIHAAPTLADGKVIVESVDDDLMTFDMATGAPGWAYQAISEPARILAATSPAVSGDEVVASFASGELAALQATNGNGLWTDVLSKSNRNSALSEIRDIPGRPVIYKGDVYAVSHSGMFAAIDLRTGTQRWTLPITAITTPWAAGDVVYVTDTSGEVACISRESGQIYWIVDLNKNVKKPKDRALWSGPILAANHLVVVSSHGEARALNPKTGALEKSLRFGSEALMTPIAFNGDLYLATQNAQLIAIR